MLSVRIGEASQASGIPERMIRHYEKLGMMPEPQRRASGYRDYSGGDVARLTFIARARRLGVPLDDVAELLDAEEAVRPARVRDWLATLDARADDLQALRADLARMVEDAPGAG